MSWEALSSAAVGAVIALSGTLLADVRRDRRQRTRDHDLDRRRICVDFIVALSRAHGELRALALPRVAAAVPVPAQAAGSSRARTTRATSPSAPMTAGELRTAAAEIMGPLHMAREQLLVTGTGPLVVAGEDAFHHLAGIRDVIRTGAALDTPEYHVVYHAFATSIWAFRNAIRTDQHERVLTPSELDRPDWTEQPSCPLCTPAAP